MENDVDIELATALVIAVRPPIHNNSHFGRPGGITFSPRVSPSISLVENHRLRSGTTEKLVQAFSGTLQPSNHLMSKYRWRKCGP